MGVTKCLLTVLVIHVAAAYDGKYREEGDACGTNNTWTCKVIAQCPAAKKELKSGRSPLVCSVFRGVPIVCCPPNDTSEPEDRSAVVPHAKPKASISRKMCEKYAKYVFTTKRTGWFGSSTRQDECGRVEVPLIINGKNASLREFPHMAQIGYLFIDQILYVCGGSLISERWVLSAAHCTEAHFGKAEFVRLGLGELDTSSDDDGARPEVIRIIQRINHDSWTGVELYNDIALYKLERDVKLTPYIRPLCLQVEHDFKSSSALATGWGHTKWEGEGSPMLQKVWLDVVNNPNCSRLYGTQPQIPQGIVDAKMMCTSGKKGEDTCQGDSGGPLQIPIANPYCMYSQIGVTSFGIECGSAFPGVFTRVSQYVPWIEKIVWPDIQV